MKIFILLVVIGCVVADPFTSVCKKAKEVQHELDNGIKKVTYSGPAKKEGDVIEKLSGYFWGRVKPRGPPKEKEKKGGAEKSASDIYPYDKDIEHLVNLQINNELSASLYYLIAAYKFEAADLYYPGMAKFFHDASAEELSHAKMLMKYQTTRGGTVKTYAIRELNRTYPTSISEALEWALNVEKAVTKEILCMDNMGTAVNDVHLNDFLESKLIPEQYDSMKQLASYSKTLNRMKAGMGAAMAEYHFDAITLKGSKTEL